MGFEQGPSAVAPLESSLFQPRLSSSGYGELPQHSIARRPGRMRSCIPRVVLFRIVHAAESLLKANGSSESRSPVRRLQRSEYISACAPESLHTSAMFQSWCERLSERKGCSFRLGNSEILKMLSMEA